MAMIVAICGPADYIRTTNDIKRVLAVLEDTIKDERVDFYLGEYHNFDLFAYECAKEYKARHRGTRLVLISRFVEQGKIHKNDRYDLILAHDFEKATVGESIMCRCKWMAEHIDLLICHILYECGEAFTTFAYARQNNKAVHLIDLYQVF